MPEPNALPIPEATIALPTLDDFDPVAAGENIAKETIVFECHVRAPGFTKPIRADIFIQNVSKMTDEEQAALPPETVALFNEMQTRRQTLANGARRTDPSMLHVSQDIIDRKEIKDIERLDTQFNEWLKSPLRSVPCKMLANGMYLIRKDAVASVDQAVVDFVNKRKVLLDVFEEKYTPLREDARNRRGPFFSETDYPEFHIIRAKYRVEGRYLSFNVPQALEKINAEIYQRETEKLRVFFADAAQETRDAARIAFQGLVDHLYGQLGNDESGKPKRFYGTSVTKLREFVEMFLAGGNLTGDQDLTQFVTQARDLLAGVDPEEVRKDKGLRSTLETGINKIKEEASALVTVQQRKFNLDILAEEISE